MKQSLHKALSILLSMAIILSVGFIFTFTQSENLSAKEVTMQQTSTPVNFVALGDSISTGNGLAGYTPPTQTAPAFASESFVELLKTNKNFASTNLAVDGLTSTQLALATNPNAMSAMQKTLLQKASVISITIGGNDLLNEFYTAMASRIGISVTPDNMPLIMNAIIAGLSSEAGTETQAQQLTLALLDVANKLQSITQNFNTQLATIVTNLKTINPKATLIIQTIANPYAHVDENLSGMLNLALQSFNNVINEGSKTKTYQVADIATAFQESKEVLTNATDPQTPMDPHPNAKGHEIIADLVYKQWEASLMKSEITTPMDFTIMESTDNLDTQGWKWDKHAKTLTLDGFHMNVTLEKGTGSAYNSALFLPDGSTIVASKNSINRINVTSAPDGGKYQNAIYTKVTESPEGLTMNGEGLLTIAHDASASANVIWIPSATLKIENMPNLNINSTSQILGPIGIMANKVLIDNSTVNMHTTDTAISAINVHIIDSSFVAKSDSNSVIYASKDSLIQNSKVSLEGGIYGWIQQVGKLTIDNSTMIASGGSQNGIYCWGYKSNGENNGITITNHSKVTATASTDEEIDDSSAIAMNYGVLTVEDSELIVDKNIVKPSITSKKVQFKGDSKVAFSKDASSIIKGYDSEECKLFVSDGTTTFANGLKLEATQEFTIDAQGTAIIPEETVFANNGNFVNNGTLLLSDINSYTGSGTITCHSDNAKSHQGHQYLLEREGSQVSIPATCTTTGTQYFLCDLCDTEIAITIATLDHDFKSEWSSNETSHWHDCKNVDCTKKGNESLHIPNLDDGNCATAIRCSICDKEIIPAKNHVLSDWYSNETHHWKKCLNENCNHIEPNEVHTWDTGTITLPPTHLHEGEMTYICKVCGKGKTNSIPKLPSQSDLVDHTTGIKATYEDGTPFEQNVALKVASSSRAEIDKFKASIDKIAPGFVLRELYDISLQKDDVEIQPDKKIKVHIPLSDNLNKMDDLQIVYIDDESNVSILPSQIVNDEIIFVTDHFSTYGVIGKVKTTNPSDSLQTGDHSLATLFVLMMMLSGTLIVITQKRKKYISK